MVQFAPNALDRSFGALADPTRRAILMRLGRSEASISDLAVGFEMTLTGLKKHVSVLEGAGLVTTERWAVSGAAGSARVASTMSRNGSPLTARSSSSG